MILKRRTIDWLCEDDNPQVKYLTVKNLIDKPAEKLRKEQIKLNEYSVVKEMLNHHKVFWGKDKHLYRKYKGGYWQLIFLGDLFADVKEPIIKQGCELILDDPKWHAAIESASTSGICLAANITRALANLGYADDPRILKFTENIASAVIKNDGINCRVMDYSLLPQCHMALPKVLMALGSYSGKKQIVGKVIKITAEKLLEKSIYRYVPDNQNDWRLHQGELSKKHSKIGLSIKDQLKNDRPDFLGHCREFKAKSGWLKFGYPLHYNSDILEAMRSLADAGVKYDTRMDDALDVIENKMHPDGYWKLEFSLNGKMWIDIEKRGKPSKWITYHALAALKKYGRLKLE